MKYLLPNGMTVDENGLQVLPDLQTSEPVERVSQVILASGIDIGAAAAVAMSRGAANDQGSEDTEDGPAAQAVNEVHAPSGEEWYYRRAQELQNEYPDWTPDQITNKMSEIVWDNNYQALIDEIAHSTSPGERERLISEHQAELDKYKVSGIKVDNDITYLRNVQGMPSIMMELNWGEYGESEEYQKDQAIVKDWQRQVDSGKQLNIDFDQAYQNEANAAAIRLNLYDGFQVGEKYGFFDNLIGQLYADHMRWGYTATLTKQDQANGYRLDYFSDVDAYLRVRSDKDIHPYDLIMYHEHLKNATNSWEKELTKGTIAGTLGLGEPDGSGWTQLGYYPTRYPTLFEGAALLGSYGFNLRSGGQRAILSSERMGDKIRSEGADKAVQVQAPILKDFEAQRQVLNTFEEGKALDKTYGGGTKLYRIGDRNGAYWSPNPPPTTELQWRMDYAIEGHWNNMSNMYVMEIPKGSSLAGLEGTIGRQSGALFGGATQTFIDWAAVPESWIKVIPLK